MLDVRAGKLRLQRLHPRMSMMSEEFMPSACEVDVTGVNLTMYAMQLAGGTPAALVDWNNRYADADDEKCVSSSIAATGPSPSCPTSRFPLRPFSAALASALKTPTARSTMVAARPP